MGQDLSTIVRDLPVEFDLEAARLGDYDRETVIRLFREYEFRTLIERLPAMTGETRGRRRPRRCASVATDGSVPAARVAGPARPAGWGSAPIRPARRRRAAGLQLSLDFDAVSRPARGPARGRRRDDGRDRRRGRHVARSPSSRRPADRAGGRDRRPVADRGPRRRPDRGARAVAGRRSRRSGVGPAARRPAAAPRRRRSRSRWPAPDGRTVAVEGAEDAADAAPAARAARRPGRRPRGQAAARAADRATTRTRRADAGRLRHPDRGLHPQRGAAQPVDRRRRRRAARPHPAAGRRSSTRRPAPGSRRSSALAVREPLERRLARGGPRPPVTREIELPLIPVLARMEATGVALDLEALGVLATRVRRRDLPARGGDLRRRRARVQPRQPEAARAGPVLRAEPAEGQADEDGLLDRRVGARGAAAGATR